VANGKLIRQWKEEAEKKEADEGRRGDERFAVAFAPDGKMIAAWLTVDPSRYAFWNGNPGKPDGSVRLWEVATGKERLRFKGHRGDISSVAFGTDGRTLATGSEDTTVLWWDVGGSEPARRLAPAELEALWQDLGGEDAARAFKAVDTVAAAPAEVLPFIQ